MVDRADPRSRFDLSERVAIITGGSQGLGRAMALGFAACGARTAIVARTESNCVAVCNEIQECGGQALPLPADVGLMSDVERIVAETVAHFGRLDVVVNNAGMDPHISLADLDEATYDRGHAVNVKGPIFLSKYAYPHLVASGHGSVINMLSLAIWTAGARRTVYRTTKAALAAATIVLAKEWGADRVRVNAIAPGPFDTEMFRDIGPDRVAYARSMTALGRIGDPVEIVPLALYLASDASSFTTGTIVSIDGGMFGR